MRVLHVVPSIDPRYGGPVVALLGLSEAQVSLGIQATVLYTQEADADTSVSEMLGERGVRIRMGGEPASPFVPNPALVKSVHEEVASADVIHIHGVWEDIQHRAAQAARKAGKPYIIRPCGMLDPWSLSQGRMKKRLYMQWRLRNNLRHAAALHFTTDSERDLTSPLKLMTPSIVEPNGVDLAEFQTLPAAGIFRNEHLVLQDKRIVLFLSRLHPKKGLDLLLPAMAGQARDVALVIAGPDSDGYRAELERLVVQYKIQDRVLFAGMLKGKQRLAAFRDADVFVLPSYQENFGNVVVESLAAGTPVIVSDQVGLHNEVSAGQVGEVVPLRVDALTDTLQRWLGDAEARQSAANRARPFVWERYDWRKIALRWEEHYNLLVSSN